MVSFRDDAETPVIQAGPRIYVQVLPGILPRPVLAMVDTAAPWCIFDPAVGGVLRDHVDVLREKVLIDSRLGRYQGVLCQGRLQIIADDGEDLDIEVLMFLSPDWPGGNFIGYEGFLDRIRFAVDPHRNRFYFSSL